MPYYRSFASLRFDIVAIATRDVSPEDEERNSEAAMGRGHAAASCDNESKKVGAGSARAHSAAKTH
jgi:hypothetical protein